MKISKEFIESIKENKVAFNRAKWLSIARKSQIMPLGNWSIWLILAGRGFGKTRVGAEHIVWEACSRPDMYCGVIAQTSGDLNSISFNGESGICNIIDESMIKSYNKNTSEMILTNGSKIIGLSAERPERFRGKQFHVAWFDELAACRYLNECWQQLSFCMRLGQNPIILATTTPRNRKLIKDLVQKDDVFVTRGSTKENAKNLSSGFYDTLKAEYLGTRLGRQELEAELLTDNPNSLWDMKQLEESRINKVPSMKRVVVALDPPITSNESSDEAGIVICGLGEDDRGYVLGDETCQGETPNGWATKTVNAYNYYQADAIVAEVNQGGDMVESIIRQVDKNVKIIKVRASKGKFVRAEPVAALYEQKRISHIGYFDKLEQQMIEFTTDQSKRENNISTSFTRGMKCDNNSSSPDRVDALVWGFTNLILDKRNSSPSIRFF